MLLNSTIMSRIPTVVAAESSLAELDFLPSPELGAGAEASASELIG